MMLQACSWRLITDFFKFIVFSLMYRSTGYQRKRFSNRTDRFSEPHRRDEQKVILPNFKPSGLLEAESNSKNGIVLQHVEPQDSMSPDQFWDQKKVVIADRPIYQIMVYNKKNQEVLKSYDLAEKSSYLVGRHIGRSLRDADDQKDSKVNEESVIADIGIPEETCSKQHCVIQFRELKSELKAYILDLKSSNGTVLNGVKLPEARYVQLRSGDVINLTNIEEDQMHDLVFVYDGDDIKSNTG